MWIHRVAGSFILLLNLIFISLIINDLGEIENNFHSICGVCILAVVIAVALGGVFTRSRMNRIRWNTGLILNIKKLHIVIFRIINILGTCLHSASILIG